MTGSIQNHNRHRHGKVETAARKHLSELPLVSLLFLFFVLAVTQRVYCSQSEVNPLFMITLYGKIGFINKQGDLVIPATFEAALEFSEGLAAARLCDRWGYIDKYGKWVIPNLFDDARSFSSGRAVVSRFQSGQTGRREAVVDREGRAIVSNLEETQGTFSEGVLAVKVMGRWGFINADGEFVIPQKFDYATFFSDGLALVRVNDSWFYIDREGRITLKHGDGNFSEGLASRCISKGLYGKLCGFIDTSGSSVIRAQFDEVGEFKDGLVRVRRKDRWGFANRNGQMVVQPVYEEVSDFADGLAMVVLDGKAGYVDPLGAMRVPPIFDSAGDFRDGLARVTLGSRVFYIDKRQQVIWPQGATVLYKQEEKSGHLGSPSLF